MSANAPRRLCYWLFHWFLLLQRNFATSSNRTLPLPQDWHEYCPYTDFCTHKAAQDINFTTTERPCCEPCSCEPDCGLKRNCCTYAMDTYRIDETEHVTCTLLATVTNMAGIRFTNFYLTVDKCLDGTSCYNFESAPWGSMYPVASKATKTIYLNDKCANCHGEAETDIQKFKIEVNCHMISSPRAFVSDGVKSAFNSGHDQANAGCFLRFLPLSVDVSPMECTLEPPISSCRYNVSMEVQTLCTSFNATYTAHSESPYANVYCRLCNSLFGAQGLERNCVKVIGGRKSPVPFSFILNMTDISELAEKDNKAQRQTCAHNELMERKTRKCRKFHCPEGQMLLAGECSFLSQKWTAGPFVAYLRLEPATPEDRFPLSQMHELSSYRGKFFKTSLHTWWRKLYYRKPESEEDTHVSYFVLVMHHKKATISPKIFIDIFKQSFKIPWIVKLSEETYTFNASLHNYTQYLHGNQFGTRLTPLLMTVDQPHGTEEELLAVKTSQFPLFYLHIPFTKAFLCKRVDLLPEEFVDRGSSLFLKVTNRSLGLAEFWKSAARPTRNETVAVCADDLGPNFWYIENAACSALLAQALILSVLVCALVASTGE